MHGEVEAAAEFLKGLDGFEALLRLLRRGARWRGEQVGVGLMVASADAAAQLVELREAELVGALHDDRVGGRDVDARLDDGRAEEQVVALLVELAHDVFELALAHLSVRDGDARFGNQCGELLAAVLDRLHLVVQEVDLAAALEFADDGLADEARLLGVHKGLDRQTALGGCRDDGEVADAFEAHRERARDRRGREREDVDLGAQLPERLLLANAEAVFLVDDDEAEALEGHLVSEKLVRADHDVDRAVGDAFERLRRLFARPEAGELGDAHGPGRESVAEGLGMLLGEQGRRAEHGHLPARRDGDEGRAQRDFGLAEAHVAADKAVHRLARRHVVEDGADGGRLVGRLVECKALAEGLVVADVDGEDDALAGLAQRIEVQELGRRVADLLGRLPSRLFPVAASESVQRGVLGIGARVARDEVEVGDRHEELGLVLVVDAQKLGLSVGRVHVHEPLIAADAVL